MSKPSPRDKPKASRKKKTTTATTEQATIPPIINTPPPISYVRLGYLLSTARAESVDSKTEFSDEALEQLAEEWSIMVDEAFQRFDNSLLCGNCGRQHKCDLLAMMLSDLRRDMDEIVVEEVNEDLVEHFQSEFERIRSIYLEEIKDTACIGET